MTLPVFRVRRARRNPAWAKVTCPRCHHTMWLMYSWWLSSSKMIARPCTYCFRVSKLPLPDNDN